MGSWLHWEGDLAPDDGDCRELLGDRDRTDCRDCLAAMRAPLPQIPTQATNTHAPLS